MAAPERFADMSDSSCTAGAVHTWPIAEMTAGGCGGRYWGAPVAEVTRPTIDNCDSLTQGN